MTREESAREEKIRQLRDNQQRWMRERQASNDVESAMSSMPKEDAIPHGVKQKYRNATETERESDLLNKITENITDRLRDELKGELRKSNSLRPDQSKDLANHLENYLSSELHTHTCQICFELMMPPARSPTLLFPCGHTFCKSCVEKNDKSSSRGTPKCPYCREKISSRAENHSLRQLIERFANQKGKLESGEAEHLDELFTSSNSSNSSGGGEAKCHFVEESDKTQKKYLAEYESCSMRHKILLNELDDRREQLRFSKERKEATRKTIDLLRTEKEGERVFQIEHQSF